MHNPLHISWMIQPGVHFQRPARQISNQQGKMLTSSASSSREYSESLPVRSSCTLCCTSALPACRRVQTCNIPQPMAKKYTYLCALQRHSEIGVVCFVSCWTAAAAEPHVDHDASAVCSSPSPVDVGPAAMDAYTTQSRVRRRTILGQS